MPDHFAAHHYLTHAYKNGGRIQEALEQGAAYARLASAIPHARHMYGHDLRRLGRIREAITEFAAADALERAYFAQERVDPEDDWHYEHNLDLLGTSYQYAGQIRLAAAMSRKLSTSRPQTSYKPSTSANGRCCFVRSTATRPRPRRRGR